MKTCVVIPTYNEKENVGPLVDALRRAKAADVEVLFVDDSSPDGTADRIREAAAHEPWVHLMVRDAKKGIGSAYRDGFRQAIETLDPDVLVEMDADLQHSPEALPGLLKAVEGGADVAVASRYVSGGGIEGWERGRRLVSVGANALARELLGLSVRDCTSGFRAYRKAVAAKIVEANLPAKGFEFQVATLHLLKGEAKIVEVPYFFRPRMAGESKLGARDMARFLLSVLKMSLG
jgi:dolichol-phosphate mannosyltransferase